MGPFDFLSGLMGPGASPYAGMDPNGILQLPPSPMSPGAGGVPAAGGGGMDDMMLPLMLAMGGLSGMGKEPGAMPQAPGVNLGGGAGNFPGVSPYPTTSGQTIMRR